MSLDGSRETVEQKVDHCWQPKAILADLTALGRGRFNADAHIPWVFRPCKIWGSGDHLEFDVDGLPRGRCVLRMGVT